jgi:hypothetical protein
MPQGGGRSTTAHFTRIRSAATNKITRHLVVVLLFLSLVEPLTLFYSFLCNCFFEKRFSVKFIGTTASYRYTNLSFEKDYL